MSIDVKEKILHIICGASIVDAILRPAIAPKREIKFKRLKIDALASEGIISAKRIPSIVLEIVRKPCMRQKINTAAEND